MVKPTIVYKIRDRDGLFSTGGSYPSFNERGKSWVQRGHLSNHLAQMGKSGRSEYINRGCEVVTFEMVPLETETVGIRDYLDGISARRQEREAERQRRVEDFKI